MFEKWEKKTVSEEEARDLIAKGNARLVRYLGDGQAEIKIKTASDTKKKKEPPKTRDKEPTILITKDEAPKKLEWQIERPTNTTTKIIKKGKVSKRKPFVDYQKRRYFTDHILKEDIGKKIPKYRFFIRWNEYYSESLENETETKPKFSWELENVDLNNMSSDLGKAMGHLASLVLDRQLIILLLMVTLISAPIGFPLINQLHLVPTTVVHWITRR